MNKVITLMNTIKLFTVVALSSLIISCSKDKDSSLTDPTFSAGSFSELDIPKDFSWSSSIKGNITITLDAPANLFTEGQTIELQDADGNVIQSSSTQNNQATFNVVLPEYLTEIYAYYPNTQDRVKVNLAKPSTTLKIEDIDFEAGLSSGLFKSGSVLKKSTSSGNNLIHDGDFENVSPQLDSRTYTKVRPAGTWYKYNSAAHITSINGSKVFTSQIVNDQGKILQSVKVDGDQVFNLNYEYDGNAGFYVLFMDKDQKYIGHTRVTLNSNGTASCKFLAAFNVRHIQLYGFAGQGEWVDNISLEQVPEVDTDGDGVVDRKDYYPNDPSRAYASFFPTIGRQIVAFEDLWPYNGDNDFNDIVLANHIEFSRDNQLNLKSATVKVQINAMGAGVANGIGLVLLDSQRNPLSNNIISGITMKSGNEVSKLDANVLNGVIVVDNLIKSLKPYYSNTGVGPSSSPQQFEFTISFTASAGNISLTPDFYIFRTSERGREIHLPGFTGTEAANPALYNTGHDLNGTYKNDKGLPWAIEIIYPYSLYFSHPLEKVDVTEAYPQFKGWAKSNGLSNKTWMLYPTQGKVFKQ